MIVRGNRLANAMGASRFLVQGVAFHPTKPSILAGGTYNGELQIWPLPQKVFLGSHVENHELCRLMCKLGHGMLMS